MTQPSLESCASALNSRPTKNPTRTSHITIRHDANKVELNRCEEHNATEPEQRRPHLRVVTLEQAMRQLESTQGRFGNELTRLRRRNLRDGTSATNFDGFEYFESHNVMAGLRLITLDCV